MATLLAGDKVLITFVGSLNGQTTMSTFTYGVASTVGSIQQDDAFLALRNAICSAGKLRDKFVACCPSNWSMVDIWIQVVGPTRYVKYDFGDTGAGPKSDYTANTSNVAAVILRRGDRASRKAISTLHVPAATDAEWITGGLLTVEALTSLGALATEILLPITTSTTVATYDPIINNGPLSGDITPITISSAKDQVRTMTRRTVGRGI